MNDCEDVTTACVCGVHLRHCNKSCCDELIVKMVRKGLRVDVTTGYVCIIVTKSLLCVIFVMVER